jgi:hypothetical protein
MIRWLTKKVIKNIDVAGKNVEIVIKKLKYLNINVICNGNAKKVESVKKKNYWRSLSRGKADDKEYKIKGCENYVTKLLGNPPGGGKIPGHSAFAPCPGPFLPIVREPRPSRFPPLSRPVPSLCEGTPAIPLSPLVPARSFPL